MQSTNLLASPCLIREKRHIDSSRTPAGDIDVDSMTGTRTAILAAALMFLTAVSGCGDIKIGYDPVNLNVWKEAGIDR